ncbi:MAG: bleomycin resistance protein [Thalassobius sp.]|nr:bleomycin resistance protein [Thalassovita sp.]
MNIKTPGIHHLALRVSNFERAKEFYNSKMGFQIILELPNLFIFLAGKTPIGIRGPENKTTSNDSFNPFRVGLDHLAIGCESNDELQRIANALNEHYIENTGIKHDDVLNKDYIAFKDPDRISWEYYMV